MRRSPCKTVLTLRRGATTQLPDNLNEAFNLLVEYSVQGKHQALLELLDKYYTDHPAAASRSPYSSTAAISSSSARSVDGVAGSTSTSSVAGTSVTGTDGYFDINTTCNRHCRTLLHMAVSAEQPKVVSTLFKFGADPNLQDKMGLTAVHIASRKTSNEILVMIISAGGSANVVDNEGLLPLHWAASCGTTDNIRTLGQLTNNINHQDSQGRTALHYASYNGHVSVLQYLIDTYKNTVDLDLLDENNECAVVLALSKGFTGCVDTLLQHGACTTYSNKYNETTLQLCLNRKMFPQAYLVTCSYPNFIKELERPIEYNNVTYDIIKQFVEWLFKEHPEDIWDLWTDLRNLVIDCAQELVDCTRTVESFPIFVKLLKHVRSLGVMTIDQGNVRKPVLKRMISFPTPEQEVQQLHVTTQEEKLTGRIEIETQNIESSYTGEERGGEPSTALDGEPSKIDAFTALDDVWKFLKKWMMLVKSYHSRTTDHHNYRFMRRPYELDANDLREVAPQMCSLIKGYHTWSEDTIHYRDFLQFISNFNSVLKLFLTFNTELIFGSLDFLLDSPVAMVEFQNIRSVVFDVPLKLRKSWFYDRLYRGTPPDHPDFLSENLNIFFIDRDQLFSSSCEQVMNAEHGYLQGSLTINFHGDDGMGVGVRREWFTLLTEKITDPMYGLFQRYNNGLNFQPTHLSKVNPDHLRHFEFAGKIIGLMIYYQNTTGIHFTKSFYKHMLGEPLDFTDVGCIDSDLASSLQWLLDNDVSDIVELTFSVDLHDFGELGTLDLKHGGADIAVTEENKIEYIRLLSEYKMSGAIKPQINSFLSGFYSVVPRKILAIFNTHELELILCGLAIIDRKDWRAHTQYNGYLASDPMITWFWEILDTFSQDELVTLLKFITGYSRVPHGGFRQFALIGSSGPIKISKGVGSVANLPKASVCFNMLLLPEYTSRDMLAERLKTAMSYASIGFDQC